MAEPATDWYYAVGGEQKGPVSAAQIRSLVAAGAVRGETLVWSQALPDWKPLSQTELASAIQPLPSGLPPVAPAGQAGFSPAALPQARPAPAATGFGDAVRVCLAKYATFSGRASRPEFWYFYLFYVVLAVVATIIDLFVFQNTIGFSPLSTLVTLGLFLPQLGVGVRRLHDTDRSGWMFLIAFIPLVGTIILVVFFAQAGTAGRNRFG